MSKNRNVPELRFKEFNDEWELKKLGELCKMQAGKFINAIEILDEQNENLYPCYGGNGIRGFTKSFNQNGKFSLIGRQGAHCGNVTLANGKFYATEHAVVVFLNNGLSTEWIYYLLKILNLNQYSTGLAQPGLSVQNLEKVETNIPILLPEQTKIASFLTSVDDKLQTLKKKKALLEQYKKGVMQKIFSQELRFKDEKGNDFPEWEEKKLGDVAKRKTLKNKEGNSNVLTISAQYGLISQLEFFNKSVSAKDVSGYYLVEKGDFAYNKSYSNGYPMGAIKRLKRYEKGVVSTLYICFTFNENIDLAFMEHYFDMGIQNKEIELVAQEGARNHGLLNIGIEDFFGIQLYLPSIPEQIKIAYFLTSIDEKINQTQFQIEKTESWKKGLLQKMFV